MKIIHLGEDNIHMSLLFNLSDFLAATATTALYRKIFNGPNYSWCGL